MFHLPDLPDLRKFGMDSDLFAKRHGHQIVSGGTAKEVFEKHDTDDNGRLNKKCAILDAI